MSRPSVLRNPYLLLIVLAIIWGSSFILMKEGLKAFSSLQVASLRIFLSGLTLLPFIQWKKLRIRPEDWKYFLLAGLLGNGIPAFLFTAAQLQISSSLAGALNGLTPLFALLVSVTVMNVTFLRSQIIGVGVGLIGAAFLFFSSGVDLSNLGDLRYATYAVLATMCYGINMNIIKYKLGQYPPFVAAALPLSLILVIGGGLLLAFNFNLDMDSSIALRSFGAVAVLAIFGTALSLIMFNDMIQQTGVVFASSVTYLIPIVALIWGVLDGEAITLYHIVGLMLILVAIWLMRKRPKPKSKVRI